MTGSSYLDVTPEEISSADDQTPGGVLKLFRKKNKISQAELSKILGSTQATISRWEKNKQYPSVESLKAFNVINPRTSELLKQKCFDDRRGSYYCWIDGEIPSTIHIKIGEEENKDLEEVVKYIRVRDVNKVVVENEPFGQSLYILSEYSNKDYVLLPSKFPRSSSNQFGYRISDDSMGKILPRNSIIICSDVRNVDFKDGDIVIVGRVHFRDRSLSLFCREIKLDDDGRKWFLSHPVDGDDRHPIFGHDSVIFDSEVVEGTLILGVVVSCILPSAPKSLR